MKDKKLRKRLFGQNYKTFNLLRGEGLISKVLEFYVKKSEALKLEIRGGIGEGIVIKCDKCKCLLLKEDAIKGEEEMRGSIFGHKFIYTPYYCLKCKPNKLKIKK